MTPRLRPTTAAPPPTPPDSLPPVGHPAPEGRPRRAGGGLPLPTHNYRHPRLTDYTVVVDGDTYWYQSELSPSRLRRRVYLYCLLYDRSVPYSVEVYRSHFLPKEGGA